MIKIRKENLRDYSSIKELNDLAFGQTQESELIDKLRKNGEELLSLVAVDDEKRVGHILFTLVIIDTNNGSVQGMGLAPMAVLPKYQNNGIGSLLVKKGIDRLKDKNCPFIIVLGHPEYYPRFGFEKASLHNIKCQWNDVPEEAFMILILDKKKMSGVSGIGRYRDEFNDVM